MWAGQTFRYALNFQQLQDRWKAEKYRLSKTETKRKSVQTLRKVDRQSKTVQNLQQHRSQAIQGQTFSLHKTNAVAKLGPQLRPPGSLCDPQSALLVYLQSNVPFSCAEEKYHCPPAMVSRKEPAPLLRGRKTIPLPREREKDVPFVM